MLLASLIWPIQKISGLSDPARESRQHSREQGRQNELYAQEDHSRPHPCGALGTRDQDASQPAAFNLPAKPHRDSLLSRAKSLSGIPAVLRPVSAVASLEDLERESIETLQV